MEKKVAVKKNFAKFYLNKFKNGNMQLVVLVNDEIRVELTDLQVYLIAELAETYKEWDLQKFAESKMPKKRKPT